MIENNSNLTNFFVITAKDENNKLVFLQRTLSRFVDSWRYCIDEYTYKFDTRKEAKTIMDIQISIFPELNKNLAAFKVKQIRPVLIIK